MAGVIKGGILRAYKDSTPIGHATSCTLAISADSVEIDNKDVEKYPTYKATKIKGTLAVDAFFSYDTSNITPVSLLQSMLNKETLTLKVSTETTGETSIGFDGIVLNYQIESTVNQLAVFSVQFQISGDIDINQIGEMTVISDSEGTVIEDSSGIVIGW